MKEFAWDVPLFIIHEISYFSSVHLSVLLRRREDHIPFFRVPSIQSLESITYACMHVSRLEASNLKSDQTILLSCTADGAETETRWLRPPYQTGKQWRLIRGLEPTSSFQTWHRSGYSGQSAASRACWPQAPQHAQGLGFGPWTTVSHSYLSSPYLISLRGHWTPWKWDSPTCQNRMQNGSLLLPSVYYYSATRQIKNAATDGEEPEVRDIHTTA